MQFLFDFVGQVMRSVLRLVLLLAAGFALSLLRHLVPLLTARSLLTGRKPAMFTTFTRFRQASRQFRQGPWSPQGGAAGGGAPPADVVDVQAHEVDERTVRAHLPLDPGARN